MIPLDEECEGGSTEERGVDLLLSHSHQWMEDVSGNGVNSHSDKSLNNLCLKI